MNVNLDQLVERIGFISKAVIVDPIAKGYSMEDKYQVVLNGEHPGQYLLRVMPLDSYPRKLEEFKIITRLHKEQLKVPEPIEIGRIDILLFATISSPTSKVRMRTLSCQHIRTLFSTRLDLKPGGSCDTSIKSPRLNLSAHGTANASANTVDKQRLIVRLA